MGAIMKRYAVRPAICAAALLLLAACAVQSGSSSRVAEVTFVDHIKAGMIEQDVYVERPLGSGQVYRVSPDDSGLYMGLAASGTAEPVHHAPMDAGANGPYAKGKDLGFSLGDWLAATGTGTLTCNEGQGSLVAEFQNLVPDGLYTMWYFFMADPPTEPFSTYDIPVGARSGVNSVFRAEGDGSARYAASFAPCLQGGGRQLTAGLAIAWHSDGKTYGHHPGTFGDKAHVHLFTALPGDGEI
jgi:hypothetical protein